MLVPAKRRHAGPACRWSPSSPVPPAPPEINSEGGMLRSLVFLNVRGRDMGGFVTEAKEVLDKH